METRSGARHARSRRHRHLQQDAEQLSQMVQKVRRPRLHRASRHGTYRRLCCGDSGLSVPGRGPCSLSGDEAADQGRVAEDEGRSEGNGRLGRQRSGITMLELRPTCEHCNRSLPPASLDARICSYECTFCATCVETILGNVCPNCGGGFVPRPVRPSRNWKGDNFLGKDPASTKLKHRPVDRAVHAEFSASIRSIPPEKREHGVCQKRLSASKASRFQSTATLPGRTRISRIRSASGAPS